MRNRESMCEAIACGVCVIVCAVLLTAVLAVIFGG